MKARFLALAALVLGLASCQTEPEGLNVNAGGEVDSYVTVSLPETTRANSALGAFNNVVASDEYTIRYIFQVFYNGTESGAARQVIYTDNDKVSFPVRLVPGRHYNFVVWADVVMQNGKTLNELGVYDASADLHYNTEDLKSIKLNGEWNAMDETRDAFTGQFDTAEDGDKTVYNGAKSINITLTRPFAKLRIVTTDMEQLNDLQITPTRATVEYTTQHYASFNAFAGGVNENVKMSKTHTNFEIKAYDDNVADESKVLFTDYFFATTEQETVKFELDVFDQNGVSIKYNNFNTDIAVQRNYLTTIQGNILTDGNNVKVTVDEAFANAENPNDKPYFTEIVEVGNAADLQEALDNSTEETVIVLGSDITLGASATLASTRAETPNYALKLAEGKIATIDLNGKTLSTSLKSEGRHLYAIDNYGTLTLKGEGAINARGIENFGTMTIDGNITITNVDTNGGAAIWNEGNLVINGGTFTTNAEAGEGSYGAALNTRENGTAVVNGGNFIANSQLTYAIINAGETTINNATVLGKHGAVAGDGSQATIINGGTFSLMENPNVSDHCVYFVSDIKGGSFTLGYNTDCGAQVFCESTIADGYKAVDVENNGVWTIVENPAAQIGETAYLTIQEAIEAVQEGETIVMLRDVNINTPAYGQNALNHAKAVSFTLDLNGKTISADTGNSVFRYNISQTDATSNITVTFKNGTITSGDKTWCTVMAAGLSKDVKAVFNLEDLTINASKAGDLAVKAWDYALINAKNVTVNATKCAGGFYAVGGEIVLDNCTVDQKGLHTAPYMSMAIAVSSGGKLTVNSGKYTTEPTAQAEGYNQGTSHGSWCAGVMNSGGELIINGGTFANGNFGENTLATYARGLIFGDTASKIVINDGTFNALKTVIDYQNNLGVQPNPNIVINGGNFSANPAIVTSYGGVVLAEGKVAAQGADGRWTLVDGVMDEAGLKAAFEKGGNIVLGADITVSETVTLAEGKTAVLNLNGKKILGGLQTDTSKHIYPFDIYGSLTINDSSANGSIEGRGIYVRTGSNLIVNGGSIYGIDSNGGSAIWQYGGDITINGGLIEQKAEGTYNFAINGQGGTVTVTGGKIAGNHGAIATAATKVVLNDGEFVCTGTAGMTDNVLYSYSSGTIIINGGTFTADNDGPAGGCCVYDANGGVTINGGVFVNSSGGDVWGTTGTTIKGGKFENLIETSHIAEGYEMNANGEVVAK